MGWAEDKKYNLAAADKNCPYKKRNGKCYSGRQNGVAKRGYTYFNYNRSKNRYRCKPEGN